MKDLTKTHALLESTHSPDPCPKCGSRHENMHYDADDDVLVRRCASCGHTRRDIPNDRKAREAQAREGKA